MNDVNIFTSFTFKKDQMRCSHVIFTLFVALKRGGRRLERQSGRVDELEVGVGGCGWVDGWVGGFAGERETETETETGTRTETETETERPRKGGRERWLDFDPEVHYPCTHARTHTCMHAHACTHTQCGICMSIELSRVPVCKFPVCKVQMNTRGVL
jgi:hypothetical protein